MAIEMVERNLVLTRRYDAPPDVVFRAWTEPEQMKHWWGPHGWSIPLSEADLRPGGAFRYAMRSPEGHEHMVEGTIGEIDPPRRIVTVSELGGDGNHPPIRVVTAVTFEEQGGATLVTVDTTVSGSGEWFDAATEGMDQHWGEHMERLGDYLSTFAGKE